MNYSQVQYKPEARRQMAVAAVAAYFVTHLTGRSEPAEIELAMLKGGGFKQLRVFCDPDTIMADAVESVFDDLRQREDAYTPDPLLEGIVQSAQWVAMLMLADVYGAEVPERAAA